MAKMGDAVVPSVGAVHPLAIRVQEYVGRQAFSGEVSGQRPDRLYPCDSTKRSIIRKRGDRRHHLTDDVGELPAQVEC